MGFDYYAIGITVLLQILESAPETSKRRKALLKIFTKIGNAFKADAEFRATALNTFAGPSKGEQ